MLWVVIHALQNEPSFSFVGGSTLILTLSCFPICLSVDNANRWISKFQLIRVVLAGLLILKLIKYWVLFHNELLNCQEFSDQVFLPKDGLVLFFKDI